MAGCRALVGPGVAYLTGCLAVSRVLSHTLLGVVVWNIWLGVAPWRGTFAWVSRPGVVHLAGCRALGVAYLVERRALAVAYLAGCRARA